MQRGVTAMKWDPFGKSYLQISNRDLDTALRCVAAVREAVGDEVDLLIEGHGRFDVPTGIRIARELEPFKPLFFEEPTPPDNLEALRAVRDKSPVAIAAGERLYTLRGYRQLFALRAADYIQPDVSHAGRHYGAEKDRGGGRGLLYSLCAAQPLRAGGQCRDSAAGGLLPEFLYSGDYVQRCVLAVGCDNEQLDYQDGYITIPSKPGLGIEIDEAACLAHPYQPHTLRHYTGALTDIRPAETAFYF